MVHRVRCLREETFEQTVKITRSVIRFETEEEIISSIALD